MKADWRAYPVNIGHKDWPGCFRCHDDRHKSVAAKKQIPASDCTSCHTILAQGSGARAQQNLAHGQEFTHPGDPVDGSCNDCHTGGSLKPKVDAPIDSAKATLPQTISA